MIYHIQDLGQDPVKVQIPKKMEKFLEQVSDYQLLKKD
jgi:hypothetical protein